MRAQSRTPDLAEVLRSAVKAMQAQLHTSLPGRVLAYDATEQKADVQPLLRRPLVASDGTELDAESLPILHDVPVAFPRGGSGTGAFFLSWPLAAGDLVHLVFVEHSIDQWLATGPTASGEMPEVTPLNYRSHDLSDAVAYPGLYPRALSLPDADADDAVLGRSEGIQIHVTPGDTVELRVDGAAEVSACVAETLRQWWDSEVKPRLDAFDAHTHATGVGPSGPPTPTVAAPAMDTEIASDRLKLKANG